MPIADEPKSFALWLFSWQPSQVSFLQLQLPELSGEKTSKNLENEALGGREQIIVKFYNFHTACDGNNELNCTLKKMYFPLMVIKIFISVAQSAFKNCSHLFLKNQTETECKQGQIINHLKDSFLTFFVSISQIRLSSVTVSRTDKN